MHVDVYQGVSHVGCCPEGVQDIYHTRHVNNDVEHHVLLVRAIVYMIRNEKIYIERELEGRRRKK